MLSAIRQTAIRHLQWFCRMINRYTTLSHNFLEIAIGNGIADIEKQHKG